MYIYVHIYIFIMNVYRSNCEASTMKERKRLFVLFFFRNLLCDEHLCVLGELSRPHNQVVHGRTLPALAAFRGDHPFSKE